MAFFYVDGGGVLNSTLRNSFASAIRVSQESSNICVENTTIDNCPFVVDDRGVGDKIPIETFDLQEAYDGNYITSNCSQTLDIANNKEKKRLTPYFHTK